MKNNYTLFICSILLAFACSSPKNEAENQSISSNEWELQIVDSIQVDYLGTVDGGDFKNNEGVIFNFKENKLIKFDNNGKILHEHSYPKEGPGKVQYPTQIKILEDGEIIAASFVGWLYEINPDLSFKKEIKLEFPTEAKDGGGLLKNLDVWDGKIISYYPGRDGANPYDPHFFRDHYLLEKIDAATETSEPIIRIPKSSRYSTDKYYERPFLQFVVLENYLYLALENEPLVHVYDLSQNNAYLHTYNFEPTKFLDNGEHSKPYEYISFSRMRDASIQQFFPTKQGIFLLYTEGISEEIYAQYELKKPENFPQHKDHQRQIIKIINPDSTLSNEINLSYRIGRILNIESLDKPFFALRNDEYIGEEQDYLTLYKLQLIKK
ncbi:hypothetical protein [Algoriphagus yeomjeoni]|uniref:6-bladed beta-propeller protein n=1 Tax=Algoriphagus yeomjeoni TaxID=291403 RepID=A0A327PQL2_9BACT|nr:hypothetical protein [Algoriphagus yeomjeoni]RAI91946.1 hypothetical protein LV83_01171 [Algoriphagus yeomjeoni]